MGTTIVDLLQAVGSSMPRHIKLKEWGLLYDGFHEPPDAYLALSDPTLSKRSYRLRTDDNGFIRTGRDIPMDSDSILVLGDSVVETMFVDESRRMCSVLERLINANRTDPVRVLNAGMTGSTTLHLLNLFINKGLPLMPSAVVLMSGIMDLDTSLRPAGFWTDVLRLTPIVRCPEAADPPRPDPILQEANFASRGRLLRTIAATAAIHEIPLVMATVPHRASFEDDYVRRRYKSEESFMRAVALRQHMNVCTREACRIAAVPLIDLEQRLANRADIFYDEFHLNELGSEIVAHHIQEELILATRSCDTI
jgi:GDSL-like Lipase/Acylhydrolase family